MAGSSKGTYFDALKQKHGVDEDLDVSPPAIESLPATTTRPIEQPAQRPTNRPAKTTSAAHIRQRLRLTMLVVASITAFTLLYRLATRSTPSRPPTRTENQAVADVASKSKEATRIIASNESEGALSDFANTAEIIEIDEVDRALIPEGETAATETRSSEDESGDSHEAGDGTNAGSSVESLDRLESEESGDPGLTEPAQPDSSVLQSSVTPTETASTAAEIERSTQASTPIVPAARTLGTVNQDSTADLPARMQPARRVSGAQPRYPPSALAAGIGGTVAVEVEIDSTGRVTATRVIERQHPDLDRAAEEAAATWRFTPALLNGQPQPDTYRARIRFAPPESYEPAVRIVTPLPAYPQSAFVAGTEGIVTLRATIDTQGNVVDVEIVEGLPYGLSEAAVDAVREWKFRPALSDGVPTTSQETLRIRFGR